MTPKTAPLALPPSTSANAASFFFQAEDGIRDFHVTGVQTCALPICVFQAQLLVHRDAQGLEDAGGGVDLGPRSEERRVGKERRSRRLLRWFYRSKVTGTSELTVSRPE